MAHPLAGLKVLDLSRVLAGPFATRMLADLGADVVKVEPPDGDVTRLWGAVVGGVPGYYHQQNVGKRNVCVDLGKPDGVALVRRLAAVADLVVENFRPGVMARLGLGYDVLRRARRDIVLLSISGFGQDGPEAKRVAYASAIHAEAGLVRRALKEGDPPADVPVSLADTNAALHGVVAALAALRLRDRTGEGQHIDIAMLDAMLATDDQLHYGLEGSQATAPGFSDIWATGAGDILTAGDFRNVWRQLAAKMGVADPTPDGAPLAEKIRLRRRAAAAFFRGLETWDAVRSAMAAMNLAWGEVRDCADVGDSPTVRHRRSVTRVDDRAGGTRPVVQAPYRFSNAEAGVRAGAPHRGEHNAQALQDWLHCGDGEIARLVQAGVLQHDAHAPQGAPGGGAGHGRPN